MKKVKLWGGLLMSGLLERKAPLAKHFCFALCSLLIVLSLAGCLYPVGHSKITQTAGEENSSQTEETLPVKPFSVDIVIGEKPAADRSVAGPDSIRIQGDIRNIFQLVVMDDDESKEIAAYVEKRLTLGDMTVELVIESLPFDKTYHFLLLMGHWNQAGGNDDPYDYVDNVPPTLLAAGLKTQKVTGSGTVTVTMWPVIVDTVFKSGTQTVSPIVQAGIPQAARLFPGSWDAMWTIQRGVGGNGLADLVKAQQAAGANSSDTLQPYDEPQFKLNGKTGIDTSLSGSASNIIRNTIGAFGWNDIGQASGKGYVNFNLAYAPFNLTEADDWETVKDSFLEAETVSVFHIDTGEVPKWIIRNGVNDLAQDPATTDFIKFMKLNNETLAFPAVNGNGGALFTVEAPTISTSLQVTNGWFTSYPSVSGTGAQIRFTTGGYIDNAELRYVELNSGAGAPSVLAFGNSLGSYGTGVHKGEPVTMTGSVIAKDLWVMLYKDGQASNPHKIQWLQVTIGLWAVPMNIKSDGDDSANGDFSHPVRTLGAALQRLQAYYEANYKDNGLDADDWIHDNGPALIYIHDSVTTPAVTLDGDDYPPIYLSDAYNNTGRRGELQLDSSGGSLITLTDGMKLYLEDITLKGISNNTAALVTVNGGELFQGKYGGHPLFEDNDNINGEDDIKNLSAGP
jgi:hypothetical protein